MSASVWFEEVNTGLLKELQNTVRYKDNEGSLVSLPDKALIVRKPEEDFKFEVFPCVSIYNVDYHFDPLRHFPDPIVMKKHVEQNTLELEDVAVPYNLTYQIDFWARYQTDMDTMTRTWLMRHFRQFNLNVVDDGGTERSCNVLSLGSIVKSDLVLNKERLFHSIAKYRIWVEIDDEMRYTKPMVNDVGIEIKESK